MFRRVKLGLALGAGGARGLAHIGVLRALERAGVRISFVAGSSIGALVGAAYALTGHAAELEHLVLDFIATPQYQESGLTTITEAFSQKPGPWPQRIETWIKRVYLQARFVTAPSVLDSDTYKGIIDFFLPDILMEDLPIPFRALGTDIRTGRPVVFKTGSLRSAVYASCAIPGLVLPLEYQDHLVVDGGVLNMVPVGSARAMGAEAVIGVDVEKDVDFKENAKSAFDQLFHIEEIQSCYLKKLQIRTADLVLKPDVGHIHWSDFSQAQELFRLGKDAVIQDLDRIQDLTRRRRYPWRRFRSSESCPDWMEF